MSGAVPFHNTQYAHWIKFGSVTMPLRMKAFEWQFSFDKNTSSNIDFQPAEYLN